MKLYPFRIVCCFIALLLAPAIALSEQTPDAASETTSCPPGFHFVDAANSCVQLECPPGANKTDAHVCDCGEASEKPFKTCKTREGLVTHCVAKGEMCFGGPEGLGKEELWGLPPISARPAALSKLEGRVTSVTGRVFVYSQSLRRWRGAVLAGERLNSGDHVLTRSSTATIAVFSRDGDRTITIDKESLFEIRPHLQHAGEDATIWSGRLHRGSVEVNYKIDVGNNLVPYKGFHLHTPTISVGARGTVYTVRHDPKTKANRVEVSKGVVEVINRQNNQRFTLLKGDSYSLVDGVREVTRAQESKQP